MLFNKDFGAGEGKQRKVAGCTGGTAGGCESAAGGVRASPRLWGSSEYPDGVFLAPPGFGSPALCSQETQTGCAPPPLLRYRPALREKPGGVRKNSCWKDPSHVGTESCAHRRWVPWPGLACPCGCHCHGVACFPRKAQRDGQGARQLSSPSGPGNKHPLVWLGQMIGV